MTWPATLPQNVEKDRFAEIVPDSRIFSPTDMGPQKVRKRFSAQVRVYQVSMTMTPEQLETFDTFFVTTTGHGTLPFDFPDPRGEGDIEVRFGEMTPAYGEFFGGRVIVTFELERLP